MDLLAETYPGTAVAGGCYFTRAAQRTIRDPEAPRGERLERVIVTDAHIDYEGDVCVSESVVLHWARLLGMYSHTQVVDLIDRVVRLETERNELAGELASATTEIAELTARTASRTVYVMPDGRLSTSPDHVAGELGLVQDIDPRPLTAEEAPAIEREDVEA